MQEGVVLDGVRDHELSQKKKKGVPSGNSSTFE